MIVLSFQNTFFYLLESYYGRKLCSTLFSLTVFAFVHMLCHFLKELHLHLLELVQFHFALLSAAHPTIFI